MSENALVILLHGIRYSSKQMQPLATFLEKKGYKTLNLSYPSTKLPLEELVEYIHQKIQPCLSENRPIHFIGFSMGGLLTRAYIHRYRPPTLGRVLFLASPLQGSEIANVLKNNFLYHFFFGPAGQQLITDQSEFSDLWGKIDYDSAAIAGSMNLNPVVSLFLPKPNDGRVYVKRAFLPELNDFIVMPINHFRFPKKQSVWLLCLEFLEQGSFTKNLN